MWLNLLNFWLGLWNESGSIFSFLNLYSTFNKKWKKKNLNMWQIPWTQHSSIFFSLFFFKIKLLTWIKNYVRFNIIFPFNLYSTFKKKSKIKYAQHHQKTISIHKMSNKQKTITYKWYSLKQKFKNYLKHIHIKEDTSKKSNIKRKNNFSDVVT